MSSIVLALTVLLFSVATSDNPRPWYRVATPELLTRALECSVCRPDPRDRSRGANDECRSRHEARLLPIVSDLAYLGERDPALPDEYRMVLAVVACNEGGYRDHATCGADRDCARSCGWGAECLLRCAVGDTCVDRCGPDDLGCLTECARPIPPGRVARVYRCNDHGSSAGMFQFKVDGNLAKAFRRDTGRELDYHDHVEAGEFYLKRTALGALPGGYVARACGRVSDPWNVALYRLGRGPSEAGCRAGSRYARWAKSWYDSCPSCMGTVDVRAEWRRAIVRAVHVFGLRGEVDDGEGGDGRSEG